MIKIKIKLNIQYRKGRSFHLIIFLEMDEISQKEKYSFLALWQTMAVFFEIGGRLIISGYHFRVLVIL